MKNDHTKLIAEIGINHNGSLDIAKKLIDVAKVAGCDFVKFQKRTPDICVPEHQKNKIRSTPWGDMKYIDYKKKIEFEKQEYDEIDEHCSKAGVQWFASVWDTESVKFLTQYSSIVKIPSALITNDELVIAARKNFKTLIISTGMSTENEIEHAVKIGKPDVIMHTNSSYPSDVNELNLNYILHLKNKYSNIDIGYSGHEYGLYTTVATVPMGAKWIERHITLDRRMWGSDHSSSVEPNGLFKLVMAVRNVEKAMGPGGPRKLYRSELEKRKSLRGDR
jgi:sialic acid synthase SpsE|tara:strand:- start:2579 stop:3412 length:834 start_codon:yes stop_codon:yes gene_type:complete